MKIGFIGCGNMGSALARAVSKADGAELYVCDTGAERCEALARETGARATDAKTIARECKFIFIAVKPYAVCGVLEDIGGAIAENRNAVIVSMAAGIGLWNLGRCTDGGQAIIRIMPNTPVAIGKGVVAWCANQYLKEADAELFDGIMAHCGLVDRIPEGQIDAESAVAGCGPAFAYMFIEALADGAVSCGLPRDKAIRYAASMLSGAAEMVLSSGKHPGALKDEVCSPGGSTIEGVRALESGGFRAAAAEAVIKAFEKTKKLGE